MPFSLYNFCLQQELQVFCVTVPPKISPFAFQTDLHLGNRAGVQCLVTNGDLPLTIEWRKDGGPVDMDVSVQQLGEFTNSLSIDSLRPHHAGNYTCLATNSAAQASHSSRLLVNGNQPLNIVQSPPDPDSLFFSCILPWLDDVCRLCDMTIRFSNPAVFFQFLLG